MVYFRCILSFFISITLCGCISGPYEIKTTPLATNEQILGQTEGSSGGVLLFGFIPIGQNTRFENAYNQALQTQPGTTRLIGLTIKEQWFYAFILEGFNFQVKGTAVGLK